MQHNRLSSYGPTGQSVLFRYLRINKVCLSTLIEHTIEVKHFSNISMYYNYGVLIEAI